MRTFTFLKRIISMCAFLFIFYCFVSCDQNKSSVVNNTNELALKADHISNSSNMDAYNNNEQTQSKDTHILLTIDTRTINQNNINTKVVFSDDRSDPSQNPGDPESFTSRVDKNMKVYWSGVAKDTSSRDEVNILGVYRKPDGGAEILESLGKDPNKDGVIVGKVKNKNVTGFEYYSVEFEINKDTLQVYLVDPKLTMQQ